MCIGILDLIRGDISIEGREDLREHRHASYFRVALSMRSCIVHRLTMGGENSE